jgi:hypothetical protein
MPITVERDDSRRLMVARAVGLVLPDELFEFVRRERNGPYAGYALLFDATGARTRAEPADVQRLLNQVLTDAAVSGPRGPVAIVATEDIGELARTYEAASHGAGLHVIRVFRSRDRAQRWLDALMD